MFVRDHSATRRIVQMDPASYTWRACALTRDILAGNSVPMREALSRAALFHMQDKDRPMSGYGLGNALSVKVVIRTDPPKGFSNVDDFLKRIKDGQKQWTDAPKEPARDVEVVTTISPTGAEPLWTLSHAKLRIRSVPHSLALAVATGSRELRDVIDMPYLKDAAISSVWINDIEWRDGTPENRRKPSNLQFDGDNPQIEIMLANDGFVPIAIERTP